MRRNTLNFILDAVALIGILALVASGFLMRWVLPPGSRGGAGKSLWGWGRHDIGDAHFYIAAGLVLLLVLHVALHWTWVCGIVGQWARQKGEEIRRIRPLTRNLTGAAFLTVVVLGVAGFLMGARANVEAGGLRPTGEGQRAGAESDGICSEEQRILCGEIERPGDSASPVERPVKTRTGSARGGADIAACGFEIRGSTTLGEAADIAGVSVEDLRSRLNLPKCATADERLADLWREHGFSMSDARVTIAELANKRGETPERN
jgi:hypothetical protein